MLCAANTPREKESRRKITSERRIGHAWRFREAIAPPCWRNLRLFTGLALVLWAQCTLPNSRQCTLCTLQGGHFYITSYNLGGFPRTRFSKPFESSPPSWEAKLANHSTADKFSDSIYTSAYLKQHPDLLHDASLLTRQCCAQPPQPHCQAFAADFCERTLSISAN